MQRNDQQPIFLKACRGLPVDRTPVWFMRQAGRYMEEYLSLRRRYTLLEICRNPDLATEVTLQPISRFDLDAAIIFADILLPLHAMGVDFDFLKGEGPVIHQPVRTAQDVKAVRVADPEESLGFVLQAISQVRRELSPSKALIGFAGAPFTVASYMIEGGYSRNFLETKLMMYREPDLWHELMDKLARTTKAYLQAQLRAGVDAVQLFDSWAGCLGLQDYRRYVLPYSSFVLQSLAEGPAPVIHFATGNPALLELLKEAGGSVIGVDWRVSLTEAWRRLGAETVLQGNLDPVCLFGPRELLREQVLRILAEARGRNGHIFNLGHGILPQTPVENVEAVIDWVHSYPRLP